MRKAIILFLAAAAMTSAQGQNTFSVGSLKYTITGADRVEVSGLVDNSVTVLNIPATVENEGTSYAVTAIGNDAFRWSGLKSVTLPASIDSIKHGGFNGSDLVSISLNEGLRYIGDYSMACKQLVTVDIPSTVEVIDDDAFFAASNLSQVTLREGLKKIGRSVFYNTGLTSVSIPASVDTIGNTAFLFCRKLTSVTISEGSLRYIGDGAFNGCTLLQSIVIPSTVDYIGLECFLDDGNLTTLNIPASVTTLGGGFMAKTAIANIDLDAANTSYKLVDGVLYDANGTILVSVPMRGLTSLDVPASVRGIGYGAFWGSQVANVQLHEGLVAIDDMAFTQSSLAAVEFPASLVWVGEQAFAATQLTQVTLPENFPYINDGQFAGCQQLTTVHIPSSVLEIYPHAFQNCNRATFYAHGSKAPAIMDYYDDWDHPFYGTGGTVYVPKGASSAYSQADWDYELTIRENSLGTLLPVNTVPAEGGVIVANGNVATPTFAITFAEPVQLLDNAPAVFVRRYDAVSSTAMLPEQPWTATLSDDALTLIITRPNGYQVNDNDNYFFTLPEGVVANEAGEMNEHFVIAHQYEIGEVGITGDINGDGSVDVDDMNALINVMIEKKDITDYPNTSDLDGNGTVDVDDLNIIVNIMLAN